jgi:hypothetical protein
MRGAIADAPSQPPNRRRQALALRADVIDGAVPIG